MSTTSRRLSQKVKSNRGSHTPGKDKGAFCVRRSDSAVGVGVNPYKGQGLKGQRAAQYNAFWNVMLPLNGIKR